MSEDAELSEKDDEDSEEMIVRKRKRHTEEYDEQDASKMAPASSMVVSSQSKRTKIATAPPLVGATVGGYGLRSRGRQALVRL